MLKIIWSNSFILQMKTVYRGVWVFLQDNQKEQLFKIWIPTERVQHIIMVIELQIITEKNCFLTQTFDYQYYSQASKVASNDLHLLLPIPLCSQPPPTLYHTGFCLEFSCVPSATYLRSFTLVEAGSHVMSSPRRGPCGKKVSHQ